MMTLLSKLLEWVYSALIGRRRVLFTVHRAYFEGTEPRVWAYFLNVTNLSQHREIEITHVWFAFEPPVHALNLARPLPKRLKPDETWETWVEETSIPEDVRPQVFSKGRLRLSTHRVVYSKRNKAVPSRGQVPGGPITKYP